MAAPALTYDALRRQIAQGQFAPVYILHGEEGYYTDQLVKLFEESALPEADREFNQHVLYAPEIEPGRVMDLCYRMPMMAPRQLVILKEAQAARADQVNRLHKYVLNPSAGTVLVIVFRGEKMKGKDLIAAAKSKGAVVFESAPIKEYNVGPHIEALIKQNGLLSNPKAVEMLKEFVGTDLSRMHTEVNKLASILGPGAVVTPEAIERNIGVSKDYNGFELIDALAAKDAARAMRIANYFIANTKKVALQQILAMMYNFYSDLLVALYSPDKTDNGRMEHLGLKSAFQYKKFRIGLERYNGFQIIEAIWALRQFDARSKGNGSRQQQGDLFIDLIFHLLSAPGNIGI